MSLAAAITGLRVDWIAGWAGKDVLEKALPADSADQSILEGNKGSWRAHMDALRVCVFFHGRLTAARRGLVVANLTEVVGLSNKILPMP